MERAALFKKKNCGKVIADVFIVSVSNYKRIHGNHLVLVFSRLVEAT